MTAAGEGPLLDPVKDCTGFERLSSKVDHKVLAPVYETIARAKVALPATVALLGFCRALLKLAAPSGERRVAVPPLS